MKASAVVSHVLRGRGPKMSQPMSVAHGEM
jgi:hypothetical protein